MRGMMKGHWHRAIQSGVMEWGEVSSGLSTATPGARGNKRTLRGWENLSCEPQNFQDIGMTVNQEPKGSVTRSVVMHCL